MGKILVGFPQGSVSESLLFLIYINDLPDELTSHCKVFADDLSLFWEAINKEISEIKLNKDLKVISQRHISGKCYLILTLSSKLQKFASHTKVIMYLTSF